MYRKHSSWLKYSRLILESNGYVNLGLHYKIAKRPDNPEYSFVQISIFVSKNCNIFYPIIYTVFWMLKRTVSLIQQMFSLEIRHALNWRPELSLYLYYKDFTILSGEGVRTLIFNISFQLH